MRRHPAYSVNAVVFLVSFALVFKFSAFLFDVSRDNNVAPWISMLLYLDGLSMSFMCESYLGTVAQPLLYTGLSYFSVLDLYRFSSYALSFSCPNTYFPTR